MVLKKVLEQLLVFWVEYKLIDIGYMAMIFVFFRLDLDVGGYGDVFNVIKFDYGFFWCMVVELGEQFNVWGVFFGGFFGNLGSVFYDFMVMFWVEGQYNCLYLLDSFDDFVVKFFY